VDTLNMTPRDLPAATGKTAQGLSLRELEQHRELGYTVVNQLFNQEELAEVLGEVERLKGRTDLIDPLNLRCRFQKNIVTGAYEFECFDPYFDLSPLLAEFSRHPRLAAIMQSIYGEPAHVCHNQLIFKPPQTEGYQLHQDFVSWPFFPKTFHTVAIALDPWDDENGCIQMYPRGHHRGLMTPADGEFHQLTEEHVAGMDVVPLHLAAGDAAIFNCLTPHRSSPNSSKSRFRRTLFYCFNADSDGGDMREYYYDYYRKWSTEKRLAHGQSGVYFR